MSQQFKCGKGSKSHLGSTQHTKNWKLGHVRKGAGISLRSSGNVWVHAGVPKLEQLDKPCQGNVRVLLQCCSHGFTMAVPSEVGDAVPVPPGSAAMKSPVAFYRRHLPVWGCLCLGSCLFLLLCLVFLNWV